MRIIALLITALLYLPVNAQNLNGNLPVDPSLHIGYLENGLRYIIKENSSPKNKVEMYLHVDSGSLDEEDAQQGLAHFLEHMAFNGSENFPAGTLVKYFESLGMTFGMHQNAFTSFDQTTYILSLPNVNKETLDKGLMCLSDFAFRLDLTSEEIDKERGVIQEEKLARSSVRQRILDKTLPILLPGSRVGQRLPIGKLEVIKEAPRQRFIDFYEKWYHPDNSTLLIVGSIKKEEMAELVKKHFSDWKKKKVIPQHLPAKITPYTTDRFFVVQDKELTNATVSLVSIRPVGKVTTRAQYRHKLIDQMVSWIVNRRLSDFLKSGKVKYQEASVGKSDFLNLCTYISSSAECDASEWRAAMKQLIVIVKRTREYGFFSQELEDAIKTIMARARRAAETESTRKHKGIIGELNSEIAHDCLPMSADQELELNRAIIQSINIVDLNSAFRRDFNAKNRLAIVELPDNKGIVAPTSEELEEVVKAAEIIIVKRLVPKERPKALLSLEPMVGKVASESMHTAGKVNHFSFENDICVHHRHMNYDKDNITVRINFAGGLIEETAENRGITDFATLPLRMPSTSKLSSVDIQTIMTGKNIRVSGGLAKDSLSIVVSGARKDLEEGLRLAYLLITDAKIEEPVFNTMKQQTLQQLEQFSSSVDMQLMDALGRAVSANDPRFSVVSKKQLSKLAVPEAEAWLQRILKNAVIEVSVVGDINKDDAAKLLAKYLGSLNKRDNKTELSRLDKLRKLNVKREPQEVNIKVETETPKSLVLVAWRGPEYKQLKDSRCMKLAAKILSSRLHEEIREKKQLTYSAFSQSRTDPAFDNRGLILAYFTAAKKKAHKAARLCRALMLEFATKGPTEKEMMIVQKQMATDLKDLLQKPSFWSNWLVDLQYHHKNLDELVNIEKMYQSYSKEDVLATLKKYFIIENEMMFIVRPR